MRILLIYHFFYPDTVISARLFSNLAEDLASSGHQVTVFISNRLFHSEEELPPQETWHEVEICRCARPNFRQSSNVGRLLNSFFLQHRWLAEFRKRKNAFDAIILGTDPQFGYLMVPTLRRLAPKAKLFHWCFDLYPEAIMAMGSRLMRMIGACIKPLARRAYRGVDVMVDIGGCMRQRLADYGYSFRCVTATPWALAEATSVVSVESAMRRKLFGNAKLGILYSGTVGRAHDIVPFIKLARDCRKHRLPVGFCFAGYGSGYQEQTALITKEDTNITLAGFADESSLVARLSVADFLAISLRDGWEGVVVPSKFFGALAIGRPVLFSGPEASEINGWIRQYGLGYRLTDDILATLEKILHHPEMMETLKQQAWDMYQCHFSRQTVVQQWQKLLSEN